MHTKDMPSVLDREIQSTEEDAFGHRHFAKALGSLIESPTNIPPFSIGLLGKWGTGKSTISAIYLKSLKDDVKLSKKIQTIAFNAWRFGGGDIKRALLRHVYLAIGGDKSKLKDWLSRTVLSSVREPRRWLDIKYDFYEKTFWGIVPTTFIYVILFSVLFGVKNYLNISNELILGNLVAIVFIIAAFISKKLIELKLQIPRYADVFRFDHPNVSSEEYENYLVEQLRKYKKNDKKGKSCERLVIFIDDLDRLSSDEMVSGLEAIRAFMELPIEELPKNLGIIFVVSCDEERISNALSRNKRLSNSDLPGTIFSHYDAHRYLDRIFQFRLEIPPFPKRDMRNYALKKIQSDMPEVEKELNDLDINIENIIDKLIHVDVQSPRNAIQLINTFSQCWWIAKQRENDGAGTDRPGGLQEGAVTKHPISLAAICVIRVNFPDFYRDLQDEPDLIKRFTDVFIWKRELENQPNMTQYILRKFCDDNNNLKLEYQRLRRYIASIRNVRWPNSITPILLLSEDPIARRLGDRGQSLFEDLVSANYQGVLEQLGRNLDEKPLSYHEIILIRDIQEELYRETEDRRNNAAFAITEISERFPSKHAHLLLVPLVRRISESPQLRWEIGIPRIKKIMPHVKSDDRREVAEIIINDLLLSENEIAFRKPSGERPSLDEAMDMVREGCDLALWIKNIDGLTNSSNDKLINWLEYRSVLIDSHKKELPFKDLEKWMEEYEEILLYDLGEKYTRLVIDEIKEEQTDGLNTDLILRRVKSIFKKLWESGEDTGRPELWNQLTALISVKKNEYVVLAWEFVEKNITYFEPLSFTKFIGAFVERLQKDLDDDDDNWELKNWKAGSLALLSMVENHLNIIEEESLDLLADLSINWSKINWSETEPCEYFSIRLIDSLAKLKDRQYIQKIIADWTPRLLDGLSRVCTEWLSKNFTIALDDEQSNQIVAQLNTVLKENLNEEEINGYTYFIKALTNKGIKSKAIQQHLSSLYSFIQTRHTNPNNYLNNIFPVVPQLIELSPPSAVGNMLQNLFVNAKSNRAIYGWLHGQMADYWPQTSDELQPYNPQLLFNEASNFIKQQPNTQNVTGVLKSMYEMSNKGIVEDNNIDKLLETTCLVWPIHQQEAYEVFSSVNKAPTSSSIADLMNNLNAEDQNEMELLNSAWSEISKNIDEEQWVEVIKLILSKNAKRTDNNPDLCLQLWFDLQQNDKQENYEKIIKSSDLNDEQLKRVWLQIEKKHKELGKKFFQDNLFDMINFTEYPEFINSIFASKEMINSHFSTSSDRYQLGKILFDCFLSVASITHKNKLAIWIKEIDASAVLKELEHYEDVSEEDIEKLEAYFPKSKDLKRYIKKIR